MKFKILSLVFVSLYLVCCATPPVPRQIVNAFPIEKPFDTVWVALIETFSDLQLPIQNMEKDSGLITTDWIDFSGQTGKDYADCGKNPLAREIERLGRLNVFVKKTSETSCEIKINCMFQSTDQSNLTEGIYKGKCVSTGTLEAEMFNLIKSKIGI